jgi:hypothetical protein
VPVTQRLALVAMPADRGDVDTAGLARIVTADPAISGPPVTHRPLVT